MPIEPSIKKEQQQLYYPLDNASTVIINRIVKDNVFGTGNIKVKEVDITVNAGSNSGSSSVDNSLVGGKIIGFYPIGNQDQFVDNVALSSAGVITITLAGSATADNKFRVIVLRK